MKKIVFIIAITLLTLATNKPTYASCELTINGSASNTVDPTISNTLRYNVTGISSTSFIFSYPGTTHPQKTVNKQTDPNTNTEYVEDSFNPGEIKSNFNVELLIASSKSRVCGPDNITASSPNSCQIIIERNPPNMSDVNTIFSAKVSVPSSNAPTTFKIEGPSPKQTSIPGNANNYAVNIGTLQKGNYNIKITRQTGPHITIDLCATSLTVGDVGTKSSTVGNQCSSITNNDENSKCNNCKDGTGEFTGNPGSWSALGCIPTGPDKFITWLLEKAINIVGGLAFLMILFGSFKIVTSSGNPEALNEGKEIIFAAIAGLLFIILSMVILKIIGADILQIPGFS